MPKKVRFNKKIEIHTLYVWNFAYKKARIGNWSQIYLDNQRFKSRCLNIETNIKYILSSSYND